MDDSLIMTLKVWTRCRTNDCAALYSALKSVADRAPMKTLLDNVSQHEATGRAMVLGISIVPALKARVMAAEFIQKNSRLHRLLDHPAGPFTIHFWAPTMKWGISLANIADWNRPAELISYPQQMAVTLTGLVWSRYSFVITPVNYNLFSVNAFMAVTGSYQLFRKFSAPTKTVSEEAPQAQSGEQ